MSEALFHDPILNSPYERPTRHWELDADHQPTRRIVAGRRPAECVTPIPKPRKRTGGAGRSAFVFDEGRGLSTLNQGYDHAPILNRRRRRLEDWRRLPDPRDWRVTAETVIWLTEVAPQRRAAGVPPVVRPQPSLYVPKRGACMRPARSAIACTPSIPNALELCDD